MRLKLQAHAQHALNAIFADNTLYQIINLELKFSCLSPFKYLDRFGTLVTKLWVHGVKQDAESLASAGQEVYLLRFSGKVPTYSIWILIYQPNGVLPYSTTQWRQTSQSDVFLLGTKFLFLRWVMFVCSFLSFSWLLDLDPFPYSQCGSGSKRGKSIADPYPKHKRPQCFVIHVPQKSVPL